MVAGPTKRKTRAVPGLTPLRIKAAAMGVDAVAQIYRGIPSTSISSIEDTPPPSQAAIISSGASSVIIPASRIPKKNQPARSAQISVTAYLSPARIFAGKPG